MLECQLLSCLSILVSLTLKTELLGMHGLWFTWVSDLLFYSAGVEKTGTSLSSVAVTMISSVQQKCLHLREL